LFFFHFFDFISFHFIAVAEFEFAVYLVDGRIFARFTWLIFGTSFRLL